MKPIWEEIHDGLIDDIELDYEQIKIIDELIKKNIFRQDIQDVFKEINVYLKIHLKELRVSYKNKYGQYPKRRKK